MKICGDVKIYDKKELANQIDCVSKASHVDEPDKVSKKATFAFILLAIIIIAPIVAFLWWGGTLGFIFLLIGFLTFKLFI